MAFALQLTEGDLLLGERLGSVSRKVAVEGVELGGDGAVGVAETVGSIGERVALADSSDHRCGPMVIEAVS